MPDRETAFPLPDPAHETPVDGAAEDVVVEPETAEVVVQVQRVLTLNRLGPLPPEHPLVLDPERKVPRQCPACGAAFAVGQHFATIQLGPGPDPEQRRLAAAGAPFRAVIIAVHWPCASGFDEAEVPVVPKLWTPR